MSRVTIRVSGAVILCGSLAATMPARAEARSADAILKEIVAITLPEADLSRVADKAYLRQFMKQRSELRVRRAELIGALYRADPDNPRLVTLLPVRWRSLSGRLGGPDDNEGARDLTGELNEVLARAKGDALKKEAAYIKAWIASDPFDRMGSAKDNAAKAKAVDDFIAFAPKDERGAELLYLLSLSFKDEPARQKALYARIVKEYPESGRAKSARGLLSRLDAVGKEFDLTFNDAISGTKISMQSLRGKIVVVDFWATWCGPCVAEMPRMKELYAKYHDKGVAFIGVSLDYSKEEGGLDKLKAFVAKNEIPWPQYYQGNGVDSDFARGLGINSIPTVFLVDQKGKLFSLDAGGKLETLIPELMNRKVTKDDRAEGRRSPPVHDGQP
jgi:thiol-disulfide isomerase/thioredoxin